MDETMAFLMPRGGGGTMLAAVNERLAIAGLSIAREDAAMLAERQAESLASSERVEVGPPAIAALAEELATSPCLGQGNLADALAELQDAFYALRDELPIDVPDAEIVEALRGSFDALEGDAAEVAALPREDVVAFSGEYQFLSPIETQGEHRIVDDGGHVYAFDPAEWDYDDHAEGWNGEEWADDWDD